MSTLKNRARFIWNKMLSGYRAGQLIDAEDLLHECLCHILEKPSRLVWQETDDPNYVTIGTLCVMMHNRCLDALKLCEHRMVDAWDGRWGTSLAEPTALSHRQGEEAQETAEQTALIHNAIQYLAKTSPTAAIVHLYSLDVTNEDKHTGDNHRHMADQLGITYTNYKQHRMQGCRRMKPYLQQVLGDNLYSS